MDTINKGLNKPVIVVVSVIIPLAVAALLFMPFKMGGGSSWIGILPHLIGTINTITVFVLLLGFYFIRKGQIANHKASMVSALMLGVVFLVCYIIYHASAPSTSYGGEGILRYIYYFFLLTHIILSIGVVPLVLFAFYFALNGKILQHKKIVKYAYPIWLYVSATGVIVYLMIRPFYA